MSDLPGSPNLGFLATYDAPLVVVDARAEQHFPEDPAACQMKLCRFGELLAQQLAARLGLFVSVAEPEADLLGGFGATAICRARCSTCSMTVAGSATRRRPLPGIAVSAPSHKPSLSVPAPPAGASGVVRLAGGNIRNGYIYLRTVERLLSADVIGGTTASAAARRLLTITFDPGPDHRNRRGGRQDDPPGPVGFHFNPIILPARPYSTPKHSRACKRASCVL
jgi:hypothetical protein